MKGPSKVTIFLNICMGDLLLFENLVSNWVGLISYTFPFLEMNLFCMVLDITSVAMYERVMRQISQTPVILHQLMISQNTLKVLSVYMPFTGEIDLFNYCLFVFTLSILQFLWTMNCASSHVALAHLNCVLYCVLYCVFYLQRNDVKYFVIYFSFLSCCSFAVMSPVHLLKIHIV